MEIIEARKKAEQILDQERFEPTTRFVPYWNAPLQSSAALQQELVALKRTRPRQLFAEQKLRIRLESSNYELLVALLGHLPEATRPLLMLAILDRVKDPTAFSSAHHPLAYPFWN